MLLVDETETYQIKSDGKTVWVNGPEGEALGRFGLMGIDIHHTIKEQTTENKPQCFACTHQQTFLKDWTMFQIIMKQKYNIRITDKHKPTRLT